MRFASLLLALAALSACSNQVNPSAQTPTGGSQSGTPGATSTSPGGGSATPGSGGGSTATASLPPPVATVTPSPAAPVNGGDPTLRLSAQGLYQLDPPMPGESTFEGLVLLQVSGAAPGPDAAVDLNGVALLRAKSQAPDQYWQVDPAGPQPRPRADRTLTLTARAGGLSRTLTFVCPADVAVTASTSPGASLAGARSLRLGWTAPLSTNPDNPFPTDFYANAHLRGVDLSSYALAPELSGQHALVPRSATGVELAVPAGSPSGYLAELRWQGPYVTDGGSDGFCGRVKRLIYAN